jgi:REP element-mobilizing transposase RayT
MIDTRATGPQWLGRDDLARAVISTLFAGKAKGFYELGSWVVMPNHVHAALFPTIDLPRIVSGIKVASAKEANRLLNRIGPFWSSDYFDRWVRNSTEERRTIRYIENNPVKARLCGAPEAWPYSTASAERGW